MSSEFEFKNPKELEEKVLEFWKKNKIFEKSVRGKKDYVFYDGPPFANGLPHYGHILASIIKDAIPRYQTMRGKKVERRWGWDCHGLPAENLIEKELGLKTKKDIENYGVAKFNEAARESVLRYENEWKKVIPRMGRWADMDNSYKTMDSSYTESVWWVFKKLFEKKFIYEGYKSMHICPRCETTLSNFEVAQGYKDIKDVSVTAKFELLDEPNTFVLAWTTTPWTLPGNVALAVNPKINYIKARRKSQSANSDRDIYILAKERIAGVINGEYEILKEFKGNELVGKKYKPLFDYYSKDNNLKNRENGWKIYGADFVNIEEGTGVVHVAPAFGEDDMNLGSKNNLPFIQHVRMDGKFKSEVADFPELSVKPKGNPKETDEKIIKYLEDKNKIFKKEEITHSYPHCWRCDTPLLNYAANSWFVKVTAIKKDLIANNKKINWVPKHVKDGRFGKWLSDARDWAISRSRFWGAPLPVWKCDRCHEIKVVGALEDLKNNTVKSGNNYFVMRHGEAENNIKNIVSSTIDTAKNHHLTEKGKKEILKTIEKIRKNKIDLIFSSDFNRTKETAEMVASGIGIDKNKIIFDSRLRETNTGAFDAKKSEEYHSYFSSLEEKFIKTPPQGENLIELKNRVSDFLYEVDKKYANKNILIITHEYSAWLLFAGANGFGVKESVLARSGKEDFIKTGEAKDFNFTPLPHNKNFELDFHRPYIDEIKFECVCGGEMNRIKDVFDCWFESGSMPYGQAHYPFENKKKFEKNFPAEFIAEGLDQTRGWFYTLLVLSTALFKKSAYKNVIANGLILAEDGQKMSKRLNNYPDPMDIVSKYGADALRLYMLSSPVVVGENLNFSEKGVDEIYKKTISRLWNVYSFYEMYADKKFRITNVKPKAINILDKWILARFNQLAIEITKAMESYELNKATRPIGDFVDDLSTWYIRRSRDRFKEGSKDKQEAILTTRFVLIEFSKLIAPFAPFSAEAIYSNLQIANRKLQIKSVHLDNWPIPNSKFQILNSKLIEDMKEVRNICSLGLEARAKAGIRVRQPLRELRIKNLELKNKKELLSLIKDEVNVKEVLFDKNIKESVELDTIITPELKFEGDLRELVRAIQDIRKKSGLTPAQKIILSIKTNKKGEDFIKKFENELKKSTGANKIDLTKNIQKGDNIKIDNLDFIIKI